MPSHLAQIELSEELLRQAMLTSDVESLNALISPNLVFTTHSGLVISKQDDLEVHRSGALKFHAIELSEQQTSEQRWQVVFGQATAVQKRL